MRRRRISFALARRAYVVYQHLDHPSWSNLTLWESVVIGGYGLPYRPVYRSSYLLEG